MATFEKISTYKRDEYRGEATKLTKGESYYYTALR